MNVGCFQLDTLLNASLLRGLKLFQLETRDKYTVYIEVDQTA